MQNKLNKVYLTFDDHPMSNTNRILDILRDFDVKATFFLVGKNIEEKYELACAIRDEDHFIGNHSYSHNRNTTYSDILKCDFVLAKKIGIVTKYFRPPYSVLNEEIIKYSNTYDSKLVGWTIDVQDWYDIETAPEFSYKIINDKKVFNSEYNFNIVKGNIKNDDILIMHGYNDVTITVLPKILQHLKELKYEFLKIDEVENTKIFGNNLR